MADEQKETTPKPKRPRKVVPEKSSPVIEPAKASRKSNRPFPAHAFSDALEFAQAIQDASGNQPIRRMTLFDQLNRSPESSASRTLITSASKYSLIKGSFQSESLVLTDAGDRATSRDQSEAAKARARFECAIGQIPVFQALYEKHLNQRLPSAAVLIDAAKEVGVPSDGAQECIDTFISNLKSVGVLRTLSGAERVVPLDHALEQLPRQRMRLLTLYRAAVHY